MKATIKLIEKQHAALVEVIQFLDRNRHSDTHLRHKVDVALNHLDKLHRDSEMELTRISLK